MKQKIFVLIFVLVLLTTLIVIFYPKKEENNTKYCKEDGDCHPAGCCHPADCVNVDNKPDCKGIMCTMECKPNTMDCGQGHCACVNNECKAIME